jgi:hypothetical protein
MVRGETYAPQEAAHKAWQSMACVRRWRLAIRFAKSSVRDDHEDAQATPGFVARRRCDDGTAG